MNVESVTIKEIAKICHVGVSTVSRAINDHPDINQDTKNRIMKAVEDYGYVPNNAARNLKITDGKTVAVLVKGITNPFFSDMLRVFEKDLAERGYSMILQHVDEYKDETDTAMLLEREKRLNGIVFLGGIFERLEDRLDRIGVPFVFSTVGVTDSVNHKRYAYVAVNDISESRRMVEYLLDLGMKRIAIICASENDRSIGVLRLDGYLQALEARRISPDPDLILRPVDEEDTYSYKNGYDCVKRLYQSGTKFDCVYAISDTLAIGAMRALKDLGLQIPEDISVAGFDGISTGCYTIPTLTTLKQPTEAMAHESLKALFEQIEHPEYPKQHNLFESELIVGESTRKI